VKAKNEPSESIIPEQMEATVFPVVGIGASAGGLDALEQFFGNTPADSGMAFVVIQHLDPSRESMMPELLQRVTSMEVSTVTDSLKIQPNCIYVISPDKTMSIFKDTLHLFEPIETAGLRLPIDYFFCSLAEDRQAQSIGIVLSGMGSDGSVGLKAIKEQGGFVLVQDVESAKFGSMPSSAIRAVMADIIAPPNELPLKLIALLTGSSPKNATHPLDKDGSALEKIVILLRSRTGNDFSQYKKNTLYRRIERRMSIHQIDKIAAYVRYLQENTAELDILFKELLIGVTNFFRNEAVWEYLSDTILPALFDAAPQGHVFRAWIPGCSTGEEAYSWAMIFKEATGKMETSKNLSLQIFGTDLDNGAIDQARKGCYDTDIVAHVSPERLSRFFIKFDAHFRVNAEIREMVVFAQHNVIKDPPFTRLDILSCRNMLIYLEADLQQKLMSLFHYSLNHKGILLLGSAETNTSEKELFTILNAKFRVYQSLRASKNEELFNFPSAYAQNKAFALTNQNLAKPLANLESLTNDLLIQKFLPATVLTTDKGDILYITGDTGKYLTPAAGKASLNIFGMARDGLRNELPMAFRRATQHPEKVVLQNLKVSANGGTIVVEVTLQQIDTPLALKGRILVVFQDIPFEKQNKPKLKAGKQGTTLNDALQGEYEQEIRRLNEDLQSTREDMQTSQEELKSTNEELQSSNEELQSANEELTTSKEEMQSMNEELHTINAELQSKIDDATVAKNDMDNLLNGSEIATLFLDKEHRIRNFTFRATKIFKLIPGDIGRLFTDLASNLQYPEMHEDAQEVLHTMMFVEKTAFTHDGHCYNVRIMPYRTSDDKINGLVITFIDVSKPKQLENALRETQALLRELIQSAKFVMVVLSEGKVIEFNPEAEMLFGRKREEVLYKNYVDLFIAIDSRRSVEESLQKLLAGKLPNSFQNLVRAVDGKKLLIEWTAHKLFDEKGVLTGIITIGENITTL